jgi:transcriptional regulator with XRE-family HTH domain
MEAKMPKKVMKGAELLRHLREKRGMSLRELEEATGINNSNLSRMENRKLSIGHKSAVLLGRFFGVEFELFLETVQ